MIVNDVNLYLFEQINASSASNTLLNHVAIFFSHNLSVLFTIFILALLFFQGKNYRILFLKTIFMVVLALLIEDFIELLYYHPRPFELDLGVKLIDRSASSSFPSSHTLTISTIAFSFLLGGFKKIGLVGLLLSALVGWSRVYLGVHFPFDILGSFMIAYFVVVVSHSFFENFVYQIHRYSQFKVADLPKFQNLSIKKPRAHSRFFFY